MKFQGALLMINLTKGLFQKVLMKGLCISLHVDRYYVLQKQDSSFRVIDSLTH